MIHRLLAAFCIAILAYAALASHGKYPNRPFLPTWQQVWECICEDRP